MVWLLSKKCDELDFLVEYDGKILPIEVKSGKDYDVHRALANILDSDEYQLPEAIVFNNSNLKVDGRVSYAPIYMIMFVEKEISAPAYYKVDLSMIQ